MPQARTEVLGHFGGKLENGNVGMTLFLKRTGLVLTGTYVAPSGNKYTVEGTQSSEGGVTLRTVGSEVQVEITGTLRGHTFTGTLNNVRRKYVSAFSLRHAPEPPTAGPPQSRTGQDAPPRRAWNEKHAFRCTLKHGSDQIDLTLRDLLKKQDGTLVGNFETENGGGHLYGSLRGSAVSWTAVYDRGTLRGKRRQFQGTLTFAPGGAPQVLRGQWFGATASGESAVFDLTGEHTEKAAPAPADEGPWLYSQETIEALIRAAPLAGRAGGKTISPEQARRNIPLIMAAARKAGITNPAHIAYILATAAHESELGASMFERYNGEAREYFSRKYDHRADIGNRGAGSGDGYNYRGRGFVQLTGRKNYRDWDRRLDGDNHLKNLDIENNPDLVGSNHEVAAKVLVEGMQHGTFTTKSLSDYTDQAGNLDFFNARRIVNGLDKASSIQAQALKYMETLGVQEQRAEDRDLEGGDGPGSTLDTTAIGKFMLDAAMAGLDGDTESIAYSCSKWTRQVTEKAMGKPAGGLRGALFGGSAKDTHGLFQAAGLLHSYDEGELQPGDIIFWPLPPDYWHVAVYVGGGKVAGNHYGLYLAKRDELRTAGKPLGPTVPVGDMMVHKDIDARGILTIEKAAGQPVAYARLTRSWLQK